MDPLQDEIFYDSNAEQMTIGAMFKSPETLDTMLTLVSEADFYYPEHGKSYAIAKTLHEQNKFDFNTFKQWVKEKNLLAEVGGIEYINKLKLSVPTLGLVTYYAEKVRDQATKRRGMQIANDIQNITTGGDFETIEEYVSAINAKFSTLEPAKKGNLVRIKDIIGPHINSKLNGQAIKSPTIGLKVIDEWMRGIGRNRLLVIAGRPGTGKTALSLRIARNVAVQNFGPVPFFSLEMETGELMDRMLSDLTGIPFSDLMLCENFGQYEKDLMLKTAGVMQGTNLLIDDTARMDMTYIASQCRKLKREHGTLGAILIDYLGLLELHQRKNENKSDAIGRVTKECKQLAKEVGCSVILLTQMNRAIEQRATKRPVMSDLRDSGSIEQDADSVIFLHKDPEKSTVDRTHIDFIVEKGRQTGVRDFELDFYGDIQRLVMKYYG